MINISSAAQQAMQNDASQYIKIKVAPLTGDPFTITDADITQGGMKIETHTLDGEELEIGNMNAAVLDLTLDNENGKFNGIRFAGAQLTASVGVDIGEFVEYMPLGVFTVDEQPHLWGTVSLTAYDNMVRMDIPYHPSIAFPSSPRDIVKDCVERAGLRCRDYAAFSADYIVQSPPSGDNLTCRQVAMWCCQCACLNGFADENGNVKFSFYRKYTPEALQTERGEPLERENGDLLLLDTLGDVHYRLKASERFISNMMIEEDDVMITGHRFIDDENSVYPADSNTEYCIETKGNGVFNAMTADGKKATAAAVDKAICGFTYRAFTAEIISLPFLQAGDSIAYHDADDFYQTIITNWEYTPNGKMAIAAKAKSLREKGYAPLGTLTAEQKAIITRVDKNISDAQTELRRQASAAVALNETAANAMGLFYTERSDENGGIIRYWHDAKNLEDSRYITMQNAGGSFSTNSGWNNGKPVWTQGADKYGNALYSLLDAIGIQAEWIRAGSISTDKLSIGLKERGTNLLEDGSFEHNVPWTDNEYDEQGQLIEYSHNDAWQYAAFWLDDVQTRKAATATADTEKPQKPTFDIGGFDGGKYREENFKGYASDAEPLWVSGVEQLEDIAVEPITHTLSLYGRVRNIPKISAEANGIFAAKMQWLDLNHKPIGAEIKQFHISSTEPGWQRRHTTVTPPNGAKYVRFAIGATCPDLEHYGQDDYTGELGYSDVAYIGIDGVMLEAGTALQAWTCSAKEAKNTGVVIDANGLNIADGKIIVQDGHGRRVLYTDGNGNLQFTGSLKTEVLSPDKQKIYGDMTVESYEIANDGLSGYLGLNFRRYAKERNRFETVGNMMMYYPPAETAGAGHCSLNISAEGGVGINGQSNVFLSQPYEELSENRNLDDITDPGYYYCGASSIVETFKNVPEKTAFWLRVERFGGHGNAVIQTFTPVNLNNEYKRWYQPWEPVGWQEWRLSSQMHAMSPADSKLLTGTDLVGQLAPGVYMVHEADIGRAQDEDAPESYNGLLYYPTRADGLLECWHPSEGGVFQRYTTVDGRVYARYQTVGGWWNRWYTS